MVKYTAEKCRRPWLWTGLISCSEDGLKGLGFFHNEMGTPYFLPKIFLSRTPFPWLAMTVMCRRGEPCFQNRVSLGVGCSQLL